MMERVYNDFSSMSESVPLTRNATPMEKLPAKKSHPDENRENREDPEAPILNPVPVEVHRKSAPYPMDLFMSDGKRLIDFVFAYQPVDNETTPGVKSNCLKKYREIFQKKLRRIGMQFEETSLEESQDGKTIFIKMHAPLKTLCVLAECSDVRLPLRNQGQQEPQNYDTRNSNEGGSRKVCACCRDPGKLPAQWDIRNPDYLTANFVRARARDFMIRDRYNFFKKVQRIQLVWGAIEKTLIMPSDIEKYKLTPLVWFPVSLMWLINEKVFVAAYPLHEGPIEKQDLKKEIEKLTLRQRLRISWANFGHCFKTQPMDEVCDYFGEKIAMYFAWLGFYTQSLILPSILSIIIFVVSVAYVVHDPVVSQICAADSPIRNWTFCPTCQGIDCNPMKIHTFCRNVTISNVMSNFFVMFFTFFMAIWAATFQERWKRKQATLASHWETFQQPPDVEQVRPEYYRFATKQKIHPITGKSDMFVPVKSKIQSLVRSVLLIGLMICVVVGAVIGIIVYKTVMKRFVQMKAASNPMLAKASPGLLETISASLINTIVILILDKLYNKLAWWLTEREYPRTWEDFERSIVMKMYLFQFVNFYALLFYLAFVEGNLVSNPSQEGLFTGSGRMPGYFSAVSIQLATILIVKQITGNTLEVLIPMLKNWNKRRKNVQASSENPYDQWEVDFDLEAPPHLGLAPEYFEMILQYGLLTMFVPAFPLAPLLALINNIFEIRIDAVKFLTEYSRAIPVRASTIGVYFDLMTFASTAAVVVNGALLAFSTDLVERFTVIAMDGNLDHYWERSTSIYDETAPGNRTYQCRYLGLDTPPWSNHPYVRTELWWKVWLAKIAFVLVFENVVFLVQTLVDQLVPDVPESVAVKQQRQEYMARQAAYNAEFGPAEKSER